MPREICHALPVGQGVPPAATKTGFNHEKHERRKNQQWLEPGPIAEFHHQIVHSPDCRGLSHSEPIQVHGKDGTHGKTRRRTECWRHRRHSLVSLSSIFRVFRLFRGPLFRHAILISRPLVRIRVIRPIRGSNSLHPKRESETSCESLWNEFALREKILFEGCAKNKSHRFWLLPPVAHTRARDQAGKTHHTHPHDQSPQHKRAGCQATEAWRHVHGGSFCAVCWPPTDPTAVLSVPP
jgi:hypothetical protein